MESARTQTGEGQKIKKKPRGKAFPEGNGGPKAYQDALAERHRQIDEQLEGFTFLQIAEWVNANPNEPVSKKGVRRALQLQAQKDPAGFMKQLEGLRKQAREQEKNPATVAGSESQERLEDAEKRVLELIGELSVLWQNEKDNAIANI